MLKRSETIRRSVRPAGWALGVAGFGVAIVAGGAWIWRAPLVELVVKQALQNRGVEASLHVQSVSLGGIAIEGLRLGPAKTPDLVVDSVDLMLQWRGISPTIDQLSLQGVRLAASATGEGVSLGQLDRLILKQSDQPIQPPPPMRIRLRGVAATLLIPEGEIEAGFDSADGRLGRDWAGAGAVRWRHGGQEVLAGPLVAGYTSEGLRAEWRTAAAELAAFGWTAQDLKSRAVLGATPDLQAAQVSLSAEVSTLEQAQVRATSVTAKLEGRWRANSWSGQLEGGAAQVSGPRWGVGDLRGSLSLAGKGEAGAGQVSVTAGRLAAADFRVQRLKLGGPMQLGSLKPDAKLNLQVEAEGISATPNARAGWTEPLRIAAGSPFAPLRAALGEALNEALSDSAASAPVTVALSNGEIAAGLAGSAEVRSSSGQVVSFIPGLKGLSASGAGRLEGAGVLRIDGPGLPQLEAQFEDVRAGRNGVQAARGVLRADWSEPGARLQLQPARFEAQLDGKGGGGINVTGGALRFSGGANGAVLNGFEAPLDFMLAWGGDWNISFIDAVCLPISWRSLELGGLQLGALQARLCQRDGALLSRHAAGQFAGGFALDPFNLAGALEGRRLQVGFGGLRGDWGDGALSLQTSGMQLRGEDGLAATSGAVTASLRLEPALSAQGEVAGLQASLPNAPSTVSEGQFNWHWSPAQGLAVQDGRAHIEAVAPPAGQLSLHEPLELKSIDLTLRDSLLESTGALRLISPSVELGRFRLRHNLSANAGEGDFQTGDLTFSQALQPYDITKQLLGVVELVRGGVAFSGQASWQGTKVDSRGDLAIRDLSFATLSLGPISGVRGMVEFDDLVALTTAPHQVLRVREINPGLIVNDGVLTFQLTPGMQLALENAVWPYAGGEISVDPTAIQLGGETTHMRLRMSGVDLSQLLQRLELNNSLRATGVVEGEFPLVFTPAGGRVENGQLRAIGGGEIAMQSPSLDETVARTRQMASDSGAGFLQALQGFRYDELALTSLNGDLDGEITAQFQFSGVNIAPVDLPTVGGKGLVGLPYRFHVSVTAPITGLARGVQSALDVREAVKAAEQAAGGPPRIPDPRR